MHGVLFSSCIVSYMLSNCVLMSMDSILVSCSVSIDTGYEYDLGMFNIDRVYYVYVQ